MAKPRELIVNIPFAGFYESMWSQAIDWEEESFCEYRVEEDDTEDGEGFYPPELRLDSNELGEILYRVTDYSAAYLQVAQDYVDGFNLAVEIETELKLGLRYESMDSPREYNFATDRIYAYVRLSVMRELFKQSKAEKHATLIRVIRGRFTSYDGFYSGYSNDLEDWLKTPLADWDHNELGTLLIATIERLAGGRCRGLEESIYECVADGEGFYSAWETAVDWPKFDSMRADARADKLEELRDRDHERWVALGGDGGIPADYRCPYTLDLFANYLPPAQ